MVMREMPMRNYYPYKRGDRMDHVQEMNESQQGTFGSLEWRKNINALFSRTVAEHVPQGVINIIDKIKAA
jgi:hypothetical protein